ncbi:phage tail protein [Rahnella inusitata]|uniref:phage tail fiber protein n=1 Tax=Rahnella inusitata TaxID=58169 RepID=UPI0039BE1303
MGLYKAGKIAISTAGAATGTGTAWTTAGTGIRTGQTILVNTNPAQQFTIQTINSATSLTLSPVPAAAIPAGTTYAILTTDALSVDGLGSQVAEAITYFKASLGGRAASGANSDITSLGGLSTPLSLEQGGTGSKTAADARVALQLGNSATATIGENSGNVMGSGSFGLGLQGSHAAFNLDTSPAMVSLLAPKGMVPFRNEANISGRINGTSPGIWIRTGGVFAYISVPHFDAGNVYISGGLIADGAPTSARMLYDNKNTTKASNGVLSAASPVARVVKSKSACLRPDIAEDSFEWCGDGVANSEARGIEIKRTAVGVYSVTGSMGFAEDSWHIKAPADPAGNGDLAIVEGEQAEDGTLTIKLFKKRYKLNEESGDIDLIPGIPMDVPANSWIDVRMEMPASKMEPKTDVVIEPTT